jgi:hypothetical protein
VSQSAEDDTVHRQPVVALTRKEPDPPTGAKAPPVGETEARVQGEPVWVMLKVLLPIITVPLLWVTVLLGDTVTAIVPLLFVNEPELVVIQLSLADTMGLAQPVPVALTLTLVLPPL